MNGDPMFTTPEMASVFSREVRVQCMLRFEAALARALSSVGRVPAEAAEAIVAACRVEAFDVDRILSDGVRDGTPAIALVARLTEAVPEEGRGFVHWGATSQDVIDSGAMLQMADGFELLLADLHGAAARCAELADRHRGTVMAGRTLLQQALPITFGLKAALWLDALTSSLQRLVVLRNELVVQLGGAGGTLAAFGDDGLGVVELMADDLGLGVPDLPWHSNRDRVAAVVSGVALAARSAGKIALDVVLLMSTEIGEVSEGRPGGSSTMPHKRNPVDAVGAQAAARLALGNAGVVVNAFEHEHERSAGAWQAEWAAVPAVFCATAAAVAGVRRSLEGLRVDAARMQRNLEADGGLLLAESLAGRLAEAVGRSEANRIVAATSAAAIDRGVDLRTAAHQDPAVTALVSPALIDTSLDPSRYLGSTDTLISRALERYGACVDA